jgi:hypothetical protein
LGERSEPAEEGAMNGERIGRLRGVIPAAVLAMAALGATAQESKPDPSAIFREIVGVYEAKVDGKPFFVTYYLESGRLRTVHADNAPVDCVPVPGQNLKFELASLSEPRPQLEFVRDVNGRIVKCLTRAGGRELLFIKRSGLQ